MNRAAAVTMGAVSVSTFRWDKKKEPLTDSEVAELMQKHVTLQSLYTGVELQVRRVVPMNILCVEVGNTRVKAGLFPKVLSLETLQRVRTFDFASEQWKTERLPQLFQRNGENPLAAGVKEPYSEISVSVAGAVFQNRTYFSSPSRPIPVELRKLSEEVASCPVVIENDAVSWVKGCLQYEKMHGRALKFPSLALTIGTAIGAALIHDENSITGIEVSFTKCPFRRLKALVGKQPMARWTSHHTLGTPFFKWKFADKPFTDREMAPFLEEYNERFYAFVEDFKEYLEEAFSVKIASLLVGGGNSRFLTAPKTLECTLLSPQKLESDGVSPDIIQLLGCYRSCDEHCRPTTVFPERAEMERQRRENSYQ